MFYCIYLYLSAKLKAVAKLKQALQMIWATCYRQGY